MVALYIEPRDCAAPSRVTPVCIRELSFVDAGRVVCRDGVCDQEPQGSLYDQYLRVWTKEDVRIGTVRFK